MNSALRRTCVALFCLASASPLARAQNWIAPTPEELKMTSEPQAPGAPAIYLNREETTDDQLHVWRKYARLKILTEGGKDAATVEIGQYNSALTGGFDVTAIAGRTIHPDGSIVAFTGKPYEKLVERSHGVKETAKVFTLPSVEVGSIIEYRYELRYDDYAYIAPRWMVQEDLFTRHAHFVWLATSKELVTRDAKGEQVTSGTVAWTPLLPAGAEVKHFDIPTGGMNAPQRKFELTVDNVPAQVDEEYMPPIHSLGYRVLFFYTPYNTQDELWKTGGKRWAQAQDKFIGPGSKVQAAVKQIVQPGDTDEQKLRRIYAAVLKLENTRFSRERSRAEEHSQGLGEVKNSDDVWERKRGTNDQLAELFVAMARAAGMKAYVMGVTSRDKNIFLKSFWTLNQLDDLIAIVNVGGKEQFFDPGQPYCPYGQLAWKHTLTQGVRQVDGGSAIAETPFTNFKDTRTDRIADLVMDEHGEATGKVTMTYRGAPALRWRQAHLRGDDTSLNHQLETALEEMMPGGMEIHVSGIQNLQDYEQPLVVTYNVKGTIATATGKRMMLPGDIFEYTAKPAFSHATRENAVYFPYTYAMLDATRVKVPAGFTFESVPAAQDIPFMEKGKDGKDVPAGMYQYRSETKNDYVTIHRNFVMADLIFPKEDYQKLHTFFTKFEARDHEPTVIKLGPTQTAAN